MSSIYFEKSNTFNKRESDLCKLNNEDDFIRLAKEIDEEELVEDIDFKRRKQRFERIKSELNNFGFNPFDERSYFPTRFCYMEESDKKVMVGYNHVANNCKQERYIKLIKENRDSINIHRASEIHNLLAGNTNKLPLKNIFNFDVAKKIILGVYDVSYMVNTTLSCESFEYDRLKKKLKELQDYAERVKPNQSKTYNNNINRLNNLKKILDNTSFEEFVKKRLKISKNYLKKHPNITSKGYLEDYFNRFLIFINDICKELPADISAEVKLLYVLLLHYYNPKTGYSVPLNEVMFEDDLINIFVNRKTEIRKKIFRECENPAKYVFNQLKILIDNEPRLEYIIVPSYKIKFDMKVPLPEFGCTVKEYENYMNNNDNTKYCIFETRNGLNTMKKMLLKIMKGLERHNI